MKNQLRYKWKRNVISVWYFVIAMRYNLKLFYMCKYDIYYAYDMHFTALYLHVLIRFELYDIFVYIDTCTIKRTPALS